MKGIHILNDILWRFICQRWSIELTAVSQHVNPSWKYVYSVASKLMSFKRSLQ